MLSNRFFQGFVSIYGLAQHYIYKSFPTIFQSEPSFLPTNKPMIFSHSWLVPFFLESSVSLFSMGVSPVPSSSMKPFPTLPGLTAFSVLSISVAVLKTKPYNLAINYILQHTIFFVTVCLGFLFCC